MLVSGTFIHTSEPEEQGVEMTKEIDSTSGITTQTVLLGGSLRKNSTALGFYGD